MKNIATVTLMFVGLCGALYAQPTKNIQKVVGVSVDYQSSSNGQIRGRSINLTAIGEKSAVKLGSESVFVDYANDKFYNTTVLPSGRMITMERGFVPSRGLEKVGEEKILGWDCVKYRTSIRSNTIEIWATKSLGFSGTFQPESGVPDGLVLKIVRNGNNVTQAVQIKQLTSSFDLFPPSWGDIVDAAGYRYAINHKDVIEVPVFKNQDIGFTGAQGPLSFASASVDSVYKLAGGTVLLRKVKLPDNVDNRSVFAEVVQWAQNDAYDRTGSIFMIPVRSEKSLLDALLKGSSVACLPAFIPANDTVKYEALTSTASYTAPLELMRFFTSFGVRGFNSSQVKGQKWADSVIYKQEITNFAPLLSGEVWIGAYIGNWVDKGHNLSLKLIYYPSSGRGLPSSKQIIPLFNTVNLLEQAGQKYPVFFDKSPLSVNFTLNEPLDNAMLIYTSTGHGGWGGGDEFNPKVNTIYLDQSKIYSYIPWRDDCATYRSLNPASGNFSNGLSSSDLSRSAWCPGTVTNPVYVPLGNLTAGKHNIKVQIPLGKPEGSSFSYWCISGAIVGDVPQSANKEDRSSKKSK